MGRAGGQRPAIQDEERRNETKQRPDSNDGLPHVRSIPVGPCIRPPAAKVR